MLTFIFRCLVSIDRFLSVALGRPCAIQEEEYAPLLFFLPQDGLQTILHYRSFDLELPSECDDEYWVINNNTLKFKQPPGKPSKVAFFNCLQRLNQIQAFALRTIVSPCLLSLCRQTSS